MKIFDFRERKVCVTSFFYGIFLGLGMGVGVFVFSEYQRINFIGGLICIILSDLIRRNLPLKNEKENP